MEADQSRSDSVASCRIADRQGLGKVSLGSQFRRARKNKMLAASMLACSFASAAETSDLKTTGLNISITGDIAQVSWHNPASETPEILVGFGRIEDGFAAIQLSCLTPDESKVGGAGTSKVGGAGTSKVGGAGTSKIGGAGTSRSSVCAPLTNVGGAGTSKVGGAGTSKVGGAGTSRKATADWGTVELVFDCGTVFGLARPSFDESESLFEASFAELGLPKQISKTTCGATAQLASK